MRTRRVGGEGKSKEEEVEEEERVGEGNREEESDVSFFFCSFFVFFSEFVTADDCNDIYIVLQVFVTTSHSVIHAKLKRFLWITHSALLACFWRGSAASPARSC